jgi:regulator of replication initiation timing
MWSKLWTLLQTVMTLARDLEQTRNDVKDIRRDIVQLTLAVQHLANQIQLAKQEDASEREKMAMQLQIEFLKFERRLPGPESRPKTNIDEG